MSDSTSIPAESIVSFSKLMRKATREVHSISDALVNAKLAFALSDDHVWLDGLIVFRAIFQWLEQNVPETILQSEYHRSDAIDEDVRYYCYLHGVDYNEKTRENRPAVQAYLDHLVEVNKEESRLMWAYVYHLYMGLLSGGQILQKKRRLAAKFQRGTDSNDPNAGYHTTTYDTEIGVLKQRMRTMLDEAALEFNDQLKTRLIEESKKVFELNNQIVRSIQGVGRTNTKRLVTVILVVVLAYLCLKWIR